jgi:hypothetical protein
MDWCEANGVDFLFGLAKNARSWASTNKSTRRVLMAIGLWLILWKRVGSSLLSSNRFSIDLPATGAQSLGRAASLPASIAIIGSCRSSSWSLRARSRKPVDPPGSRPRARSIEDAARREGRTQTGPSFGSLDRSLPVAALLRWR